MSEGYKIRDQARAHFLTFTVTDWVDIFSRKIYRDIVIDSMKYCQKEKGLLLFGYVIMSNHIHLIAQSNDGHLSDLVRDMKKYIARKIINAIQEEPESRRDWILKRFAFAAQGTNANESYKFWQSGNHPEEIVTEKFFWIKLNYIHLNVVRAGIVNNASDYIYCSASNYTKNKGIIDVQLVSSPKVFITNNQSFLNYELW
jgi:REP element-mobilizing transposase RayT